MILSNRYLVGSGVGIFLGLCTTLVASDPTVINFNDLKSLVMKQNGGVAVAKLQVDGADSRAQFIHRSRGGQVSISMGVDALHSSELASGRVQPVGGIEAVVPVYRGGQDDADDSIQQIEISLAQLRQYRELATQLGAAQVAYWHIAYAEEMIRNSQQILVQISQSYRSAQRRFQRGLIPSSDLMVFEIYKDQLTEQLESFRHEKAITTIRLKAILGLSESESVQVNAGLLPHVHDELVVRDVTTTFTFREAELNSRMTLLKRDKTLGKLRPSVELLGRYTLYNEADRPLSSWNDRGESLVGARLNLMLWDGQQMGALVDADGHDVRAAELELTTQRRVIAAELDATREELVHLHELIHGSEQRVAKSRRLLQTIIQDYDRGVKDSTDVLATLQMVAQVQSTYAQQRWEYQLKAAKRQTL